MSDSIGRNQFIAAFTQANPHGFYACADLEARTRGLLGKAGVSQDDLYEIAGEDGVIRGEAELPHQFRRLDEGDGDGSAQSLGSGTVRAAVLALLHDARAAEVTATPAPAAAAPPPRRPSAWARAHYRDVMVEMKRRADGLGDPKEHDVAGTVLKVTNLALHAKDLSEVGFGVPAAATTAGTVLQAGLGPVVALGTALYEIGEANHAAEHANAKRVLIRNFAAGIAAGLDPAGAARPPRGAREREAYLKGHDLVARMTPAQRQSLEDVLVLARRHGTTASVDYGARTYLDAIMDVAEGTWKPAR